MIQSVRPPSPAKFKACPFCGGEKLSQTHIWPKWLMKLLPVHAGYTQTGRWVTESSREIEDRFRTVQDFKRDLFAQQPYIACVSCNGGWMKGFEDRTSPVLKRILDNNLTGLLTARERLDVAGWLALVTLLAEMKSPSPNAISSSDVEALRRDGAPPSTWSIFIGRAAGPKWHKHYQYHNAAVFNASEDILSSSDRIRARNVQITTMGIGALLAQVFTAPRQDVVVAYRASAYASGLDLLWPSTGRPLSLDELRTLRDANADHLADAFYREHTRPPLV